MKKQIFTLLLVAALCSGKANAATADQTADNAAALNAAAPSAGNSSADNTDDYQAGTYDQDPLESINRPIFRFNTAVDDYILAPVARGYVDVVPAWGRQRVTNILYNLSEPVTFVNSVLQADPQNSFTSLWRFLLNSSVGILGSFDVAREFGLMPRKEDFGQTFAVWGWTNSTYIVIPILGPSNTRDGIGLIGDYIANPFYDGLIINNDYAVYALGAVDAISQRADLLPVTDDIAKTSLDPYVAYRSYYTQHRQSEIDNTEKDGVHTHYE